MTYNPDIHHRHSIRLKGYDYSKPGTYFITICTHNRESLLGNISNGAMYPNEYGHLAQSYWKYLERYHTNIRIDEHIIMPNHLHGIIVLMESSSDRDKSIPEIIRGFKTFSARQINKIRGLRGVPVWQRNYYDSIIQDRIALDLVRQYIINNPRNWKKDDNSHPQGTYL
jgi:putative transposase